MTGLRIRLDSVTESSGRPSTIRWVSRFGQHMAADQVFAARTSGDLAAMRVALDLPTNAVDRHYLLQGLVEQLHHLGRKDHDAADEAVLMAAQHIGELPALIPELIRHENAQRQRSRENWAQQPRTAGQPLPEGLQGDVAHFDFAISAFGVLERAFVKAGRPDLVEQMYQSEAWRIYRGAPPGPASCGAVKVDAPST